MLGFFKKIRSFFKKKSTGTALLETALTLPIVLYVVFFAIELVRIGLAQSAVDAITKECTFSLMANGNTSKFDEIFAKYRPRGIPIGNFRYYARLYPHMTSPDNGTTKGVMDVEPYGGETICWVGSDYANPVSNASPTQQAINAGGYGTGDSDSKRAILSKYKTKWTGDSNYGEVGWQERKNLLNGEKSASGYIFVLTVAVKFPFSSAFIAKLFNGGTNTDKPGVYILWARGSGMIN